MTVSRSGPFRAASVVSAARARDKLKRRDKPYKTEQSKVLAKKRRIQFETSYIKSAPRGYVFLPVGTPDLAELCKELSRQRNMPVNVVNAKPRSEKHRDPNKVSHHIQRIGYHFHGEIVEQACTDLGYIPYENRFVKQSDLEKRNQDSVIGKIMSRHGVQRGDRRKSSTEDLELVRASIKELFPRIPTDDLNAIVKRAWEDGTGRVGTASDLDLPRRVQLATIARIRHSYTDYDQLLRAFDWAYARHEVEPVCLAKLVEWRGEQDAEDNELEEIVRETIVIDDDDDDGVTHSVANGTDTDDNGDISDTSVEISHRPAAAEDLRVEDDNDRYHRYPLRSRIVMRDIDQDKLAAKEKIGSFRRRLQPQATYAAPNGPTSGHGTSAYLNPPLKVDHPPSHIVVGGQIHFLEPRRQMAQPAHNQQLYPSADIGNHTLYEQPRSPRPVQRAQGGSAYANDAVPPHGSPDQPVPSIERVGTWQRGPAENGSGAPAPIYRSRPATPDDAYLGKRQRAFVDLTQPSPHHRPAANVAPYSAPRLPPKIRNYRGDIVDLTTPPRQPVEMLDARPEVIRVSSSDARYVLAPRGQLDLASRPNVRTQPDSSLQYADEGRERYLAQPAPPAPPRYDQLQPIVIDSPRDPRAPNVQPIYQPIHDGVRRVYGPPQDDHLVQSVDLEPHTTYHQQLDPSQHRAAYPFHAAQSRPSQAPVHGAPAPVQQMQRMETNRANVQHAATHQYAPTPPHDPRDTQEQSHSRAYSVGQYYTG